MSQKMLSGRDSRLDNIYIPIIRLSSLPRCWVCKPRNLQHKCSFLRTRGPLKLVSCVKRLFDGPLSTTPCSSTQAKILTISARLRYISNSAVFCRNDIMQLWDVWESFTRKLRFQLDSSEQILLNFWVMWAEQGVQFSILATWARTFIFWTRKTRAEFISDADKPAKAYFPLWQLLQATLVNTKIYLVQEAFDQTKS